MIYTIRFWRYGQWNYIPDEPVNSVEEAQRLVDKYNFIVGNTTGFETCQIMVCNSLSMIPLWKVYES